MPFVALRKESVDRNLNSIKRLLMSVVALRKESVDRNLAVWAVEHVYQVALRKESVDRNFDTVQVIVIVMESLSARRAWIEILTFPGFGMEIDVALRKESVDRNY